MLKNEEFNLELYILDGEFSYLQDKVSNAEEIDIDNPRYAYNLFKILNKANELGAFDKVKPDPEKSDEDIETIYV